MTKDKPKQEYREILAEQVPDNVRWDTAARHQGRIIEVQYGRPTTGDGPRSPNDDGDPYMREIDHSTSGRRYFRLE